MLIQHWGLTTTEPIVDISPAVGAVAEPGTIPSLLSHPPSLAVADLLFDWARNLALLIWQIIEQW